MIRHVLRRTWWVWLLPAGVGVLVLISNLWYAFYAWLGYSAQGKAGGGSDVGLLTFISDLLTFAWIAILVVVAKRAVGSYVPPVSVVRPVVEPEQADWR